MGSLDEFGIMIDAILARSNILVGLTAQFLTIMSYLHHLKERIIKGIKYLIVKTSKKCEEIFAKIRLFRTLLQIF